MRKLMALLMVTIALHLSGCGYNNFQTQDEQVTSIWAEVVNQYQRRADLIPNLVNWKMHLSCCRSSLAANTI